MKQLTNEEKATVFTLYYPLKPVSRFEEHAIENTTAVDMIVMDMQRVQYFQLPLIPLGKITDEHVIEVWNLQRYEFSNKEHVIKTVKRWLEDNNLSYQQWQYLIQQDYAAPLFFGLNHWANGKTAIELGIAIDKTQK